MDYKKNWYTQDFEKGQDGSTLFEIGDVDEDADGDAGDQDEDEFANEKDMEIESEKTDRCECTPVSACLGIDKYTRVRVVEYDRPLPAYTIYLLEDDLLLNLDFYAHFHSATRAAADDLR